LLDFLGESLSGGDSDAGGHGDIVPDDDRSANEGSYEGADEGETFKDAASANEHRGSTDKYTESNATGDSYGVTRAADANVDLLVSEPDARTDGDQYLGANGNEHYGPTDEYTGANSNALLSDAGDACANPDGLSDDGANTDTADSVGGVTVIANFSSRPIFF